MLMETRDSLLLIVRWPAVRASFGSLVVSGWTGPPAERDVEILVMNHVVVTLAWAAYGVRDRRDVGRGVRWRCEVGIGDR